MRRSPACCAKPRARRRRPAWIGSGCTPRSCGGSRRRPGPRRAPAGVAGRRGAMATGGCGRQRCRDPRRGALLWSGGLGSSDADVDDATAPESVALARVVAEYPDEAVFTSMIQDARNDEFTSREHPMNELASPGWLPALSSCWSSSPVSRSASSCTTSCRGVAGRRLGLGGPPQGPPPEVKKRMLDRLDRELKLTPGPACADRLGPDPPRGRSSCA